MSHKLPRYVAAAVLSVALGWMLGCSKVQPTAATSSDASNGDSQIISAIQGKLYADPSIQSKQISVDATQGVVTLSGTVATDVERTQASAAAATVPGVKTVVNNIVVNNTAAALPVQSEAAPEPVRASAPAPKPHASRPAARHRAQHHDDYYQAPSTTTTVAQDATPTPASPAPAAPVVPPPPPPPPAKVTVASGTSLAVRLVDSVDSETAQPGQTFHATLESPLAVDGEVVVPAGYDVQGHVVQAQSAGKFQGRSVLALQLDRIQVGSKHYTISTSEYRREGSSRTKNTAEKVGAGAVIGAIIGGIAGGGKGAGIGAAAGGGLGGGVQAATKGQQIKLPSETVLTFSLQAPLTVTPTTQGPDSSRPKLDPTPPGNSTSNPNPQR